MRWSILPLVACLSTIPWTSAGAGSPSGALGALSPVVLRLRTTGGYEPVYPAYEMAHPTVTFPDPGPPADEACPGDPCGDACCWDDGQFCDEDDARCRGFLWRLFHPRSWLIWDRFRGCSRRWCEGDDLHGRCGTLGCGDGLDYCDGGSSGGFWSRIYGSRRHLGAESWAAGPYDGEVIYEGAPGPVEGVEVVPGVIDETIEGEFVPPARGGRPEPGGRQAPRWEERNRPQNSEEKLDGEVETSQAPRDNARRSEAVPLLPPALLLGPGGATRMQIPAKPALPDRSVRLLVGRASLI